MWLIDVSHVVALCVSCGIMLGRVHGTDMLHDMLDWIVPRTGAAWLALALWLLSASEEEGRQESTGASECHEHKFYNKK